MAPKKIKAKVSQADLRKIMQQMKTKKLNSEPTQNNSLKRSHHYMMEDKKTQFTKSDPKKLKVATSSSINNAEIVNNGKSQTLHDLSKKREYSEVFNKDKTDKNKKFQKVAPEKPKKGILLVSGFSSESSSDNEETKTTSILPTSNGNHSKESTEPSTSSVDDIQEKSLPAGFFDDPEVDAKIRGVETPADKMDREWESFQRELQRESGQSEQIVDDEQETGNLDRQIEEIDEQMQLYKRMEKLSDKKYVTLKKILKVEQMEVDDSDSDSSDNVNDILDWREKDVFI